MKMFLKLLGAIVMLALVAAGVWLTLMFWNYSKPPQIKLTNHSERTLQNVIISGNGFSQVFPALSPGGVERFRVQPNGESSAAISFNVDGKPHQKADLAYLERKGGYFLDITIQTNLEVTASTGRITP